jgi:alpha-beta hydrolase superfamily lysophospholipase
MSDRQNRPSPRTDRCAANGFSLSTIRQSSATDAALIFRMNNVTSPVLGVFGELDSSTDASDATSNMRKVLSDAGHRDFMVKIFPNAGHSLGEMPANNRMASGVFETLRSWLLNRVHECYYASW